MVVSKDLIAQSNCDRINGFLQNIGREFLYSKKNIGEGTAVPLFSAVGLIWFGHWLEQKTAQKACAAMSFLLFSLSFRQKLLVVKTSMNFSWKSNHFVSKFVFVSVQNKKVANFFIWWQYIPKLFTGHSMGSRYMLYFRKQFSPLNVFRSKKSVHQVEN